MRGAITQLSIALGALTACDMSTVESCPSGVVEMRAFSGPPVMGNRLECAEGAACAGDGGDGPFASLDSECERLVVHFGVSNFAGGRFVDLYLSPDERDAYARTVVYQDVEPSTEIREVSGGWIAMEKWEEGLAVGRFEVVVVGGGAVSGDFDTRIQPDD